MTKAVIGTPDLPIAQNGYGPSLNGMVAGGEIVYVGGISNALPFFLVTRPDIASPDQMRGGIFAISSPASSSDIAIRLILQDLGLDPDKDVSIRPLGGEPDRAAAMETGQIHGTVVQHPRVSELEKQGYHIWKSAAEVEPDYPNTSYIARKDFLRDQRDVAKRFFMALIEGIHAYKTDRDRAIDFTGRFLQIDDRALVEDAYDYFTTTIFPDVPKPSVTGIQKLLDALAAEEPKAAQVKAEDLVDMSILEELEQEGFVKEVLGK